MLEILPIAVGTGVITALGTAQHHADSLMSPSVTYSQRRNVSSSLGLRRRSSPAAPSRMDPGPRAAHAEVRYGSCTASGLLCF